jgi:hypothetical protein
MVQVSRHKGQGSTLKSGPIPVQSAAVYDLTYGMLYAFGPLR